MKPTFYVSTLIWYPTNLIDLFKDENIQTVALSSGSDPAVGEMVEATGWGKDSDNAGGISPVLREVTVPIESNENCDAYYGIVKDSHICIDSTGGHGTCNVSTKLIKLCTLQKKEVYAWRKVRVKCFKICHISYIWKPKVAFSIFHFVLLYFFP